LRGARQLARSPSAVWLSLSAAWLCVFAIAGCASNPRASALEPVVIGADLSPDQGPAGRGGGLAEGPGIDALCPAPELGDVWTCSMHPQVRALQPGTCPICGMDLIEASGHPGPADQDPQLSEQAPADVAAIPAYAHVTPSGLGTCVLRAGFGARAPEPDERVEVMYVGWSTEGQLIDSTARRGPATMRPMQLIAGWREGLDHMVEGEVRRLWIPEELGYLGRPGVPLGMLVFDVYLLRVHAAPP